MINILQIHYLFLMINKNQLFGFLLLIFCVVFQNESVLSVETKQPVVLVTVAPHRFFVEKIAGDTLKIVLVVPAGSSAHTFEPSPRQMLEASQADIWFRIGEPFENKAIQSLKSHNQNLEIIDLRQGLDLITGHTLSNGQCCHCHGKNSEDLHFWLSVRLAQQQAKTIAEALINRYPAFKQQYIAGLEKFLTELQTLDDEMELLLKPVKNRVILVSHPAYAYFTRDYDFTQLSIEYEGKDPTPKQLTKILLNAREYQTQTIFVQKQYNSKGAQLIAKEIGANVVILDPYSEDYFNSIRTIASHFASQKQ